MMRRYAGKWHRFTQPDPHDGSYDLTNPQSSNRYAYVQNDPVNFIDPTGLDPDCTDEFNSTGGCTIRSGDSGGGDPGGIIGNTGIVIVDTLDTNPGTGVPQNAAPNVNDLESRITKMVSNPDCAKFISDLINGTATAHNPAEFTDALVGFGKIKSQSGFVYGNTIMKAYGFAGGTVHGSISRGDAQVELPTPAPFPVGLSRRGAAEYISDQGRINAETVLHEILHLAGRGYDDFAYANAVAAMRGVKPPDYSGMAYRDAVRKASDYWNGALMGACRLRGPRYEQH